MNTNPTTGNREPNTSGLRPWRKGQRGNPLGRKPKELVTVERMRKRLARDLPAILESIVEAAKGGDIQAARTILERVLPPLKAIESPVFLEPFSGSLSEQGKEILCAMARGALGAGQATQLLGALTAQARIVEIEELARRLTELEKRLGAANGKY